MAKRWEQITLWTLLRSRITLSFDSKRFVATQKEYVNICGEQEAIDMVCRKSWTDCCLTTRSSQCNKSSNVSQLLGCCHKSLGTCTASNLSGTNPHSCYERTIEIEKSLCKLARGRAIPSVNLRNRHETGVVTTSAYLRVF